MKNKKLLIVALLVLQAFGLSAMVQPPEGCDFVDYDPKFHKSGIKKIFDQDPGFLGLFNLKKKSTTLVLTKKENDAQKSKVCGFISYSQKNNAGEIEILGVDQKYRRKKLGSFLLKYACSDLLEKKVKEVALITIRSNGSAEKFYKFFGFRKKETFCGVSRFVMGKDQLEKVYDQMGGQGV